MSGTRTLGIAGILLCALGGLLGTPALYVPGLAALLAATVAPTWVGLTAIRTRVTLGASNATVQEGESVTLTVTVWRGLMPFRGAEVVPWPGAGTLSLPARRRCEIAVSARAARRGRQTVGPARLRVADPLGIAVRELCSDAYEVLVLPQVYPLSARALGPLEERTSSPFDAALEVDSLRPYSAGGQASRIHWPAVARTGTLMERGLAAETDPRVLVVLDAHRPESEAALDQALRATASLCVHLARRRGCLLLLPDDRRASMIGPDLRSWPALHARLAFVQASAGGPRGYRPRHGQTVLYVTACDDLPVVRGPCFRVGPRPLAGLRVAFSVAGFTGQLLSSARASSP